MNSTNISPGPIFVSVTFNFTLQHYNGQHSEVDVEIPSRRLLAGPVKKSI